ncbi:MAG: hypothetical protein WKF30_09055, partial [Pyrinomonadaceae bacterium]
MPYQPTILDYESVGPSGRTLHRQEVEEADWSSPESVNKPETPSSFARPKLRQTHKTTVCVGLQEPWWSMRRG